MVRMNESLHHRTWKLPCRIVSGVCYDLVMGKGSSTIAKDGDKDEKAVERDHFAEAVAQGLANGLTPPQIATKLSKGDKRLAKNYRKRIRDMAYRNPGKLREAVARQAAGDLLMGVPGTVKATTRRAHRGRMDAARLVLEATGVHNPRVRHEHSGDIKITVDIPRPHFADTTSVADDLAIEDANEV